MTVTQVTCRLQSEREVVTVDANGKEVRRADGEIKTENITIGMYVCVCIEAVYTAFSGIRIDRTFDKMGQRRRGRSYSSMTCYPSTYLFLAIPR